MSKRDKRGGNRAAAAAPATPEERRARVLELMSSGKTREALDLAKQWHKDAPSAEAEALVIDAYEARISQMLAQGLHDDATALAALVAHRFPAQRRRLVPLAQQSKAIATGDLEAILAELAAAPPALREETEENLVRELRDPRQSADASALPPDDPLRQGARAVSEVFAAVTGGPLPPGALSALDRIPRQSPLAPWKLLIRGIDAYYRRADGVALANLDAIQLHAAPARLAAVLRRLIGEPAAGAGRPGGGGHDRAGDQKSVSALISAVIGGHAALRDHLRQLIAALARRDATGAAAVVERIMPLLPPEPLWTRQTFTATLLWHWHRLNLPPRPLIAALRRDRRNLEWERETQRLLALMFERAGL